MLRKKEAFTVITPIPGFIPRQLAIDILHSHSEVINLNPLVLDHKPIAAPQNAETDEYYATWYEITERVTFVPGIGRMGASIIKFNGCFHDMPWGLQTHIYAPMNVDLRNKYRIAGNQPNYEPPEQLEIGLAALGAPSDGLYLREDIEIKCSRTVMSFVKSQMKKAGGEMVRRIIKKAELLDAGVLQAMIEDGKLKTFNPADKRNTVRRSTMQSPGPQFSPTFASSSVSGTPPHSPPPMSPGIPYQIPRPLSATPSQHRPNTSESYSRPNSHGKAPAAFGYGTPNGPQELPATNSEPASNGPIEMPGDFYHAPSSLQPHSQPSSNRNSNQSCTSDRPQASPNPSSHSGFPSPGLDKNFGLQTHQETSEEHRDETLKKLDPRIPHPSHYAPYNPADYGPVDPLKVPGNQYHQAPQAQQLYKNTYTR
ncbi:hypothetical protein SMACR_01094 [Sordaria macrospora]|uniref:WGS project CABT00000000 data, contig 2.2 n=2 Tax=Sordaria macrospora TaxID=5147 RepID=F7VM90_SORMK|nr:uncharacterized protein SMAC_01094 [Sordaria macrospora k-hell]KAA8629339.1 hypothetical protein SMACR_01094 [Sordaria macrospora]KAH7630538.1 hypothetical protein B0T09DRAFT_121584 [Sordaria sp. MPI-SDFR-AT-0083]WPJ62329.1 hypothetical protein SMAC4_01094 [Sordaria macrospora]CCC07070.1 unnamed protein product [Sordaria macrospora k-hell]